MDAFLPKDNCPEDMILLFEGGETLGYKDRFKLLLFLVGNGYPREAIVEVFWPRLSSSKSESHFEGLLREVHTPRQHVGSPLLGEAVRHPVRAASVLRRLMGRSSGGSRDARCSEPVCNETDR
jgi:hypothetical protein